MLKKSVILFFVYSLPADQLISFLSQLARNDAKISSMSLTGGGSYNDTLDCSSFIVRHDSELAAGDFALDNGAASNSLEDCCQICLNRLGCIGFSRAAGTKVNQTNMIFVNPKKLNSQNPAATHCAGLLAEEHPAYSE